MEQSHPAVLALPVELLFEIVKESIFLPQFLDVNHIHEVHSPLFSPDVIRDYKYQMEDAYWEVNRHINVLRRVCKSLDFYLRPFEHRHIRLTDVYHDRVPIAAVSKAIRIDLTPWCCEFDKKRECDLCYPSESPRNLDTFFSAIPDQEFAVEIVTGQAQWGSGLVSEFLEIMHSKLRGLKAIFDATIVDNDDGYDGIGLMRALNSTDMPQLQFLHVTLGRSWSLSPFTARNLTTFAYCRHRGPFPAWMARAGSQKQSPALQNLSFPSPISDANFSDYKLIGILKVFGPQLRSLRIGDCGFGCSGGLPLPQVCWELCPQLERIDTTLTLEAPPPQWHPIQTISVFAPNVYIIKLWTEYREPFQMHFLNEISGHNRRIVVQRSWKVIFNPITSFGDGRERGVDIRSWVLDCATTCKEKGVRLEDCYGVAFEDAELASFEDDEPASLSTSLSHRLSIT